MKRKILCLCFLYWFVFSPLFASENTNVLLKIQVVHQILLFISFFSISIGILSSGYALSISLSAYAAVENKNRAAAFVPAIMPGSQGLYSFAISFLMLQNMIELPLRVSFAGIICGLPCFFSAIGQAKTAASCIRSINSGQLNQGEALLATGIPELYALIGLAGGFLAMTM